MTWVKIDDHAPEHPKFMALGKDRHAAMGLWLDSLGYAARYLTDGVLPGAWVRQFPKRLRDLLVNAGLWELRGADFAIHDYLDYNPSRAKVLADREKRSAAGRDGAEVRWRRDDQPSDSDGKSHGKSHGTADMNRTNHVDAPVPVPLPLPVPRGSTRLSSSHGARPGSAAEPQGTNGREKATSTEKFADFIARSAIDPGSFVGRLAAVTKPPAEDASPVGRAIGGKARVAVAQRDKATGRLLPARLR